MNRLDLLKMAAGNLWRRKLRTFLTILGVVIGTASIVVMMSLGFGVKASQEEMFSQFGDVTVVNVYPSSGMNPMESGNQKRAKLDKNVLQDFKNIPGVIAVSPITNGYGTLKTGRYESYANITGINISSMEDFEYEVEEGRLLTNNDRMTKSIPVVVGKQVQDQFYNPKSRTAREINVNMLTDRISLNLDSDMGNMSDNGGSRDKKNYDLNVVGILKGDDYETSGNIFMSFEDLEKINKEEESDSNSKSNRQPKKGYENVKVKADSRDTVIEVQEEIKALGFEAHSMQETLDSFEQGTLVMQAVLGGIGAISLIVAAIGITNTMIMSIYERTREIGIMKVIGASIQDIKRLFLIEAAYIGFLGGLIGLLLSYLISYVLNTFAGLLGGSMMDIGAGGTKISIIPGYLAFVAVAFSVIIGLLAGYFPAKRAMNLSALEAIRTE